MVDENKVNETTNKQSSNWENYKRIANYLAPYKKSVILLLLVVLLANILMIIGPYLTSLVIDYVIPRGDITLLILIIVGYVLTQFLNAWTIRYRQYNITLLGQNVLCKSCRFRFLMNVLMGKF